MVDVIGEEKVVELQEKKRAADKEKDSEGDQQAYAWMDAEL